MLDYKIKVVDTKHEKYFNQCKELAKENHVDNGGTIKDPNLVNFADYLVCAVQNDEVVGFAALKPKIYSKNDIHIMQITARRGLSDKKIQEDLYKYVIHHSKNFQFVNIKNTSFLQDEEYFFSTYEIKKMQRFDFKLYYLWTKNVKGNKDLEFTEIELGEKTYE